jgi:hypothetical protein
MIYQNKRPNWRNWIARKTSNLKVAGSSPALGACSISSVGRAPVFQAGRRRFDPCIG